MSATTGGNWDRVAATMSSATGLPVLDVVASGKPPIGEDQLGHGDVGHIVNGSMAAIRQPFADEPIILGSAGLGVPFPR